MNDAVTRFGASWFPLDRAAGVLRARAQRFGVELAPSAPVDLAAAVIAADAWMLVCGASTLDLPAQHGADAVVVLAAVLRRAAGVGEATPAETSVCSTDPVWLAAAERYARWAEDAVGSEDAPDVLRRAATDLAAAGPDGPLASMAELLGYTADSRELI